MDIEENPNQSFSMDSNESVEIDFVDESGSVDYENPRIENICHDAEPNQNVTGHFDKTQSNSHHHNRGLLPKPKKKKENPEVDPYFWESGRASKYTAMLERLEQKNVALDESVGRFRYNINYERRNFLSLIKTLNVVCPKKTKEFLKNEVNEDKIHSGQSCMQCGIIYYLPSFQLLR